MFGGYISCRNVKYIYYAHIFTRTLVQTCSLESTSLCLHTRLHVKKFPNSHNFFWNLSKRLTVMCSPRNDKYNPSFWRPICWFKVCYALGFYVSADFLFRILRSWKARFSHRSISPHEVCTKDSKVLGGHNSSKELKWRNKRHFCWVESSIMPIGNTNIHIQIMCQCTLIKSFSILFSEFIRVTCWN